MELNKIHCGGDMKKLLMTWKIINEHTIQIETVCRFCRGMNTIEIDLLTGTKKERYNKKR